MRPQRGRLARRHVEVVDEGLNERDRAVVRGGLIGTQAFDGRSRRARADGVARQLFPQIDQSLDSLDAAAWDQPR